MATPALSYEHFQRVWFLTWTTYATWLPGDDRGFVSPKYDQDGVERRNNLPETPYDLSHPELRHIAASKVVGEPVYLNQQQAVVIQEQFQETADYRGWTIVTGVVMPSHVHLLVGTNDDPDPATLLRDFKSYASRRLNRQFDKPASGRWWTEQGSKRKIKDASHFESVRRYILGQEKPLLVWESAAGQGTHVPRSPD